MRKIFLVLILALLLSIGFSSICLATVSFEDSFETWTNATVASGWTGGNLGGGGEWNQIYSAGQAISCGGDGTNYKAVYRDISARAPYFYWARVEGISNAMNTSGVVDGNMVRINLQFLDANNNVLATFLDTGADLDPTNYTTLEASGFAPAGSATARVVIQVMGGTGGGAVFKNFNFYEMVGANDPNAVLKVGQNMTRNTEWLSGSKICQGWNKIEQGGGAGEFAIRATGGSSQGVSCSGTTANFRDINRTFDALPGYAYQAAVYVVSNSMNSSGVVDASMIVQYMEFLNSSGTVLATFQSPGNQYNVKPSETTTLVTNGTSPAGTSKVRVTLRIFGGTGGGTVFDNFQLIYY